MGHVLLFHTGFNKTKETTCHSNAILFLIEFRETSN